MIGIVGAMASEIRRLNDELENAAEDAVLDLRFRRGELCGHDAVVTRCGAGKVNAAACTQAMILRYAPRLIVNLGVAGSLNGRLGLLDIAVGRDAVQHDVETKDWGGEIGYRSVIGSVVYPCDGEAREAILSAARALGFRAVPARIASGDQFVSDPAKKKEIADFFRADACDMESGAVAHVCLKAGVRCAVIRAISDATDGAHGAEFRKFMETAADRSIAVLKKALTSGNNL